MFDLNRSDEPRTIYPVPDQSAMGHDPPHSRPDLKLSPGCLHQFLILINVLAFIVAIISGVDVLSPRFLVCSIWALTSVELIFDGQWWRLLSSMFLHIGIIHIAFNMYVLWQGGLFIERMLGNAGFLIVYCFPGRSFSQPDVASISFSSAGAAGAVFGMASQGTDRLPGNWARVNSTRVRSRLTKAALAFLGYNLILRLLQTSIDLADHIGGLVTGFVCGLILAVPLTIDPPPARTVRNGAVLVRNGSSACRNRFRITAPD